MLCHCQCAEQFLLIMHAGTWCQGRRSKGAVSAKQGSNTASTASLLRSPRQAGFMATEISARRRTHFWCCFAMEVCPRWNSCHQSQSPLSVAARTCTSIGARQPAGWCCEVLAAASRLTSAAASCMTTAAAPAHGISLLPDCCCTHLDHQSPRAASSPQGSLQKQCIPAQAVSSYMPFGIWYRQFDARTAELTSQQV